MLTLLYYAKRLLTVPELVDAIIVNLSNSLKFNPRRRLRTENIIRRVYPGFIEVD
jgi:ankyrin repeat domain-containing protein 50